MPASAVRGLLAVSFALALLSTGACLTSARRGPPADLPVAAEDPSALPTAGPLVAEAIVVDRKGAPVQDMSASEFDVIVEGKRRVGVAVAHLYRGPGAGDRAAMAHPAQPGHLPARAEPDRVILLVIDQPSLLPGDDQRARVMAETCLGLFGLRERVGVLRLPLTDPSAQVWDRDGIRDTLGRVRGLRTTPSTGAEAGSRQHDVPKTPDSVDARSSGQPDRPTEGMTLEKLMPAGQTDEAISAESARDHARASLTALHDLVQALGELPGGKTVLLLSAGIVVEDAAPELRALIQAAARSHVRICTLQVPTSATRFHEAGRGTLESIARETGGANVTLQRKPEEALQRLAAELSSSYLLVLRPSVGDQAPGPFRLDVRSRRKDVVVRAAGLLARGRVPADAFPSLEVSRPTPRPVDPAGGSRPPDRMVTQGVRAGVASPARPNPALDALLGRASEYVSNYGRELSAVVSEETYEQETRTSSGSVRRRRLLSDFLIVKVPGLQDWVPFRDVFEVDGQQVRDRQDRLVELFIEAPTDQAVQNANRIWSESARYNIGAAYRNVNVPTLPLLFLERSNLSRFEFAKQDEESVAGMRMWVVRFRERMRPTIIRTSGNLDVPSSGRIWMEPVSGRVVRTELRAGTATITTVYAPRPEAPGLWLPVMMQETYALRAGSIKATATYSKFRRFRVFTEEKVKIPK